MKVAIIAHPNSKRPRIERDLLGTLHIYVKAPPLEGQANKEIAAALVNYFKVKKTQVEQVSGAKSKSKLFEIKTEI